MGGAEAKGQAAARQSAPGMTAAAPATGDAATGVIDSSAVPSLGATVAGIDRKVVSTANLQVEVGRGKFQSAFAQALAIADRYGGYVVSAQSAAAAEESTLRNGTITLRVPSESFSRALRDVGGLGTVKSRQVDSQDVTDQYVDLQARLKNAEAQQLALQELLAKAKTVDEVLQVRQVLSTNQQEIEQLKGQLQYLKEHTSYGTMTVSLFEAGAVVAVAGTPTWGFVGALEDALRGFVDTVNALIVGLGSALPILILLALAGWILYRVFRSSGSRPAGGEGREG